MISWGKTLPLITALLAVTLLAPHGATEAQTVEHIRSTDHISANGVTDTSLMTWFNYLCDPDKPLCGNYPVDLRLRRYEPKLPRNVATRDVQPLSSTSLGWRWVNTGLHGQEPFCFVGQITRDPIAGDRVLLRNSIHRVTTAFAGGFYPVDESKSTCTYEVNGVPEDGLLQWSGTNGAFGVHDELALVRRYWDGAGWQRDTVSVWGGAPIVGSLVQGGGTGIHGEVYGLNESGQIFTTWNNGGEIEYAIIPGTDGFHMDSLVYAGNGVLYGMKKAGLHRVYWSGGWQVEHIPSWGSRLVSDSLIAANNQNVFGVNNAGQAFTTWNNGGVTTFALIPGATDLVSDSLVKSPGHGLFAVKTDGSLVRIYWNAGAWQTDVIPHWGPALIPDSFVPNTNNGHIIGVNVDGQLVGTYTNAGAVTFAIIPGVADVVPHSIAVTPNGLFSVRDDGELLRSYWAGSWNTEVIPHTGAPLVPESLIPSEIDQIYGLNEDGEVFATWIDGGSFAVAILP
ncbi:MAG: hypothetical protein AAGM22_28975 [Acidobacteriota bacterium]